MATHAFLRNSAVALVRNLLHAQRTGNVKREQAQHEKLEWFCTKHNLDFTTTLEGAKSWLGRNSVAAVMNGLNTSTKG